MTFPPAALRRLHRALGAGLTLAHRREDLVVPAGKVFAMGDNRTHSLDGRFWGFVPRENILGRPLFNYWSFRPPPTDRQRRPDTGARIGSFFTTAIHIPDKTRWKRTLHLIK